ncbi:MAG: hypothetical protein ACOCVW_03415 [bacterium]
MIEQLLADAPTAVRIIADGRTHDARKTSARRWETDGVEVAVRGTDPATVTLASGRTPVEEVVLRWRSDLFADATSVYGDAWERGYGDLTWQPVVPERVLPWYFLAAFGGAPGKDGATARLLAAGVGVAPAAFASWRVDAGGVTLVLDVRNGSVGVELGGRELELARVFARTYEGVSAFAAARDFARVLAGRRALAPAAPVYGGNNWYYAYGSSSREDILADSRLIADLAPPAAPAAAPAGAAGDGTNRPFMVIDDGWQLCRWPGFNGGPWIPNDRFADMAELAAAMRETGVRPGIWTRPLLTSAADAASLAFPHRGLDPDAKWDGVILDPSRPGTLDRVAEETARIAEWGFELVKHDFTTYDLLGRWGFQMGARPAGGSWSFADRSRTSAEIIRELYATIRRAAPEALIIGCNAIGHLAVGEVHLQRTGDDTSGREWERTRKMGINTLAFRAHQHDAFFAVDADCVGLTAQVPWEKNAQWLDLLARSGTPLFVSAAPDAMGDAQRRAVAEAFARAATPQSLGEPLDWMHTTCPSRWRFGEETVRYEWFD